MVDLWISYDAAGREAGWKWRNLDDAAAAPLETTDRAVAMAALAERAPDARSTVMECTSRAEVEAYTQAARAAMYEKWRAPYEFTSTPAVLSFSVDRSGALRGACLERAANADMGRSVVRALFATAPFPPLPDAAACLEGLRMVATFRLELP